MRHLLFTQRNMFPETGISMLNTAVDAADAVRHNSEFDPWGMIGVEAGPVINDLKSCRRKSCGEGRQSRIHGSDGLVQIVFRRQLLVSLRPARLYASQMLLRLEMFSVSGGITNWVTIAAVDLCQVPERVKRCECQKVMLLQKTILC